MYIYVCGIFYIDCSKNKKDEKDNSVPYDGWYY